MDKNTLVSSSEITEFLDQQTISEEKATGLRLLRRAANTIDHLAEKLDEAEKLSADRLAAIQERDEMITALEAQLTPHEAAMQQAALFGRALVGLSYENDVPKWVVHGAREILEYAEKK